MTTVRQLERAWKQQQFERMFSDLATNRPESALRTKPDGGWVAAAAAMALVRLDELGQAHLPFCTSLIRAILRAQQPDGGWGDLATTAICLRALATSSGYGVAIDQGMGYLANLQKPEGIWPNVPLRRMPHDAAVSALLLFELGDNPTFHARIRVAQAVEWFRNNEASLVSDIRLVWRRAELRCQRHAIAHPPQMVLMQSELAA